MRLPHSKATIRRHDEASSQTMSRHNSLQKRSPKKRKTEKGNAGAEFPKNRPPRPGENLQDFRRTVLTTLRVVHSPRGAWGVHGRYLRAASAAESRRAKRLLGCARGFCDSSLGAKARINVATDGGMQSAAVSRSKA